MKIFKRIICSLLIVLSLSLVASAAYTTQKTVYYKTGYNFPSFSGCEASTKLTTSPLFKMYSEKRTSFTAPQAGIILNSDPTTTGIKTGLYTLIYKGSIHKDFSLGEKDEKYNAVIYGNVIQVGTDSMSFKYDLDEVL